MKKNTDYANRIESLRNRGEFDSVIWATDRLQKLSEFIRSHPAKNGSNEVFKYVPIACVACFEGVCRVLIKELIDIGNPYLERSAKLVSKFDFTIFNEINKKQFTIGEFIGHSLSCNRLEDINTNFSAILNVDFLEQLKLHSRVSYYELQNSDFHFFNNNSDRIFETIKRVFELRHVFCHELALNTEVTFAEAEIFLDTSIRFITQLEDYINEIRGISYEKMLPEQIEDLEKELEESEIVLGESIESVRKIEDHNHPEQFKESFEEFLEAWNKYAFAKADWQKSFPATGGWQTYAKLQSLIKSNNEMIELLKEIR